MGWAILVLLAVGVIFMALGFYVESTGRSADESIAAVIPWIIGIAILAIDGILLIGFIIYKAFA